MVEPLSSNTQEQMRALCKKISVAHDLDPEIQDELYGHMEDKLLAYLNGEEPVTEDDAFILVREHFGDPAVLKGLLQDVHADNAHVSLAHRLATKENRMSCASNYDRRQTMQRSTLVKHVCSISKVMSLFGLLGLTGAAGIIEPRYFWLSFLSFFSYFSFLNYFRFFFGFFDAQYRVKPENVHLVALSVLPMFAAAFIPPLAHHFPAVGFLGFSGYLGLLGLKLDKTSQVQGST